MFRVSTNAGVRAASRGATVLSMAALTAVFAGAFTGTWTEQNGPELVTPAEARSACNNSCEYTARSCVKKCLEPQKPCLDKCNIDPDQNLKNLKPKDGACAKACMDKAQPCENGCQARRSACMSSCPS